MTDLTRRLANLSPAQRQRLEARLRDTPRAVEPIAIVGMGCRFAGAADLGAYWRLIAEGIDAIGEIPASRWDVDAFYDPTGVAPGKAATRWGGFVDEVDQFDPLFFGIAPREAARMDPQQRLLLEVAWRALEDAGWPLEEIGGSQTGVFVGIGGTDYSKIPAQYEDYYKLLDAHVGTGNALSIAANRLSYVFDLRGPSMAVDTACSSGLLALHLATQALRRRECDAALAGGVNLILTPEVTIAFSKAQMLSTDGRCRPFDAGANGYVRGEGCGMLVLRRLTDAIARDEPVLAVLRGTASNQDGRTSGITAPNAVAQQQVIRAAHAEAGRVSGEVGYVEAHGTATPLGDPIEFQSLSKVFRRHDEVEPPCYVTSVKANIGHTETVSGIAGVIKVVLMMQHDLIPAQLHLEALNPYIDLEGTRLAIPTVPLAWHRGDAPRVAGVSSFGFGGTNVHVVVEDVAQPSAAAEIDRPHHLLALSAKTADALPALAGSYRDWLERHPDVSVADFCNAVNTGRTHFPHRKAVRCAGRDELIEKLAAIAAAPETNGAHQTEGSAASRVQVAMVFTGQGSQYAGMGRALYQTEPTFRQSLDECTRILDEYLDEPLLDLLFADDSAGADADSRSPLDETAYTQPALFAIEYALARLWESWGVRPTVLLGHSVGEYVAACLADCFSLEDALKLIAHRGRLMQMLAQNGAMAVVFADERRVAPLLADCADSVSLAATNGPENTVISGEAEAVAAVVERLEAAGVRAQRLNVSHAFHSPLMEPMLDDFRAVAEEVEFRPPSVPVVSNVTGKLLDRAPDADYWCRHIRGTVRFAEGMQTLADQKVDAVVEAGPAPTLLGMARRLIARPQPAWIVSLRKGQDDSTMLVGSLAALFDMGASIDWRGFDRGRPRRRLSIPGHPFHRERHWIDHEGGRRFGLDGPSGPVVHPLLGSRVPAAVDAHIFQVRMSDHHPAWLADHQVQGSAVVPAAAYLEAGLAAAREVFGEGHHAVENLSIQQALFLPEGEARVVQVTVSRETGGESDFEVYSAPVETEDVKPSWTLHACGRLRHADRCGDDGTEGAPADRDVAARAVDEMDHDTIYSVMGERGLRYGPSFRSAIEFTNSDHDALARIEVADGPAAELPEYICHPAVLDIGFQLVAAVVPREEDGGYSPYTYMPTAVGRLRSWAPLPAQLTAYAVRRDVSVPGPSPERVTADVWLFDETSGLVAELTGVVVQRVGRAAAAAGETDRRTWLYQVDWLPAEIEGNRSASKALPTAWLILADSQGVGREIARRLTERGDRCVVVEAAEAGQAGDGTGRIDPLDESEYARLLEATAAAGNAGANGAVPPLRGVLHLWSLDTEMPDDDTSNGAPCSQAASLATSRRLGVASQLLLLKQAARNGGAKPPHVWLVTRGAQGVESSEAPAVAQAPVWGLGRVAAMEHPELAVRLVDLDPAAPVEASAERLVAELTAGDDPQGRESQLAYRGGERCVARLRRSVEKPADEATPGLSVPRGEPFQLRLGRQAGVDHLQFEAASRLAPGPGQVELEVRAAGLNFSDVLKAMGLYPGITDAVVPLGIECSGVVTRVGEGVERFVRGEEVVGVAPYSFGSHAVSAEYALIPKPAGISHGEAATIPITFLTAHYALCQLARLGNGERVLIHAGAGGVGLAAIQIAQHLGAEVFATAGSDVKRDFLRSLGVEHVMNSRNLDFADEVMETTGREGIDVVLNSLPGEAIPRSLSLLRAYGRFLEIGKIDIYQNRMLGLAPFQDNLSYFAIDLDRLLRQRPDEVRDLFAEVAAHFERGDYRPLPLTSFSIDETADAFRYMQQRKNIGKIVVSIDPQVGSTEEGAEDIAGAADPVRADGTYLVTGGLGALGLRVADWLAEQNAGGIVLLARRPPSGDAAEAVARLRARGVRVETVQADVADADALAEALDAIPGDFPPLRGVIHAAGVLADGLLCDMTLDQLGRPLAPKVAGAWNLHVATRHAPLEMFVLFSSVASVLGSPGQANYAAGNAFLDGLAAWRRAGGLPATSVNWGPWAESGMAAAAGVAEEIEARGMRLLAPDRALELLDDLIGSGATNVSVADVDWSRTLGLMADRRPRLLDLLAGEVGDGDELTGATDVDDALRARLVAMEGDARALRLEALLLDELARIMGMDRDTIDVGRPLRELGLDSLMAMELKNNLEGRLAFQMPMAAFIESPTARSLAGHAARALAGDADDVPAAVPDNWSPRVDFVVGGDRPPLLLVHPLGGDIRCYSDLVPQLAAGRPVIGLQGRGSEGLYAPHASFEEIVDLCVEAVVAAVPSGPCHLAGWSAGGIFAYEIARRLQGRGRELGAVTLVDTPLPSIYAHVDLQDDVRFLCDFVDFVNAFSDADMNISYEGLRGQDADTAFQTALDEARRAGVVGAGVSEENIRRIVDATRAHVGYVKSYSVAPIDHPVILIRPQERGVLAEMSGQDLPPDLGWGGVLGDSLIRRESPGDHFSMLTGDGAAHLAALLVEILSGAEAGVAAESPSA